MCVKTFGPQVNKRRFPSSVKLNFVCVLCSIFFNFFQNDSMLPNGDMRVCLFYIDFIRFLLKSNHMNRMNSKGYQIKELKVKLESLIFLPHKITRPIQWQKRSKGLCDILQCSKLLQFIPNYIPRCRKNRFFTIILCFIFHLSCRKGIGVHLPDSFIPMRLSRPITVPWSVVWLPALPPDRLLFEPSVPLDTARFLPG